MAKGPLSISGQDFEHLLLEVALLVENNTWLFLWLYDSRQSFDRPEATLLVVNKTAPTYAIPWRGVRVRRRSYQLPILGTVQKVAASNPRRGPPHPHRARSTLTPYLEVRRK